MVSTHRYCHAGRQRTRGALTGGVQAHPGDVQEAGSIFICMNTTYDVPPDSDGGYLAGTSDPSAGSRTKRWHRWGAGAALAGFLIGGGITLAAGAGGGSPPLSNSGSSAANTASSPQAPPLTP